MKQTYFCVIYVHCVKFDGMIFANGPALLDENQCAVGVGKKGNGNKGNGKKGNGKNGNRKNGNQI